MMKLALNKTTLIFNIVERYERTSKEYISARISDVIKKSDKHAPYYAEKIGLTKQALYNVMKNVPMHKINLCLLVKFAVASEKDIDYFLEE
jgi:hypothetical protein